MASNDANNDMPPPPPMPPNPLRVTQTGRESTSTQRDGQNRRTAAVMPVARTPPPRVVVPVDTRTSAISSLSTGDDTSNPPAAATARISNINPMDGFESSDDEGGATLNSPDKEYNFMGNKSDEDSVASGDDSTGWEDEAMRVMHFFEQKGIALDAEEEAALQKDAAIREIYEWELIAGGEDDEEGLANPTDAAPPNAQPFEIRKVVFKATVLKSLKAIALVLKTSQYGTKQVLFNRLRDLPAVQKISDDEFHYHHPLEVGADGVARVERTPAWVLLTPTDLPPVEGVNLATGASDGFFGPTNKENAVGGKRTNFLTSESEKIIRPEFGPKQPSKKRTADGQELPVREDGHPSDACRKLIPPLSQARPKDFFDTQLTPEFIKYAVDATNLRAYASGASSGEYADFIPFDVPEFYKMFGVLFANGLTPKPIFDLWFSPLRTQPLLGSDMMTNALRRTNQVTGKKITAGRRYRHFRRYLSFADYRANPKEEQKKNPLWKVERLLAHLNKRCRDMWIPGKWVAIDEQTLGFQGASGMKLRISYKREGDGFQCDAVCDAGYTFSFWFRHGPPPELDLKYKHLDLSPTARRVVYLAERLPNKWTRVYMDNLFNSQKLYTALYITETLGHGVARTSGRGVPLSVIQREEKNKDRAEKLRGTTMAARLLHSAACPDLLAVSTYDTKPVHILSMTAESVKWDVKERSVWSAAIQKKAMMKYLRLNVIEEYNNHMNATDIADQLRGNYRPDRWMRQRKWWWAFFIWSIGVAGVNAYKIYEVMYEEEVAKKTPLLPKKWTHAQFLEELVYDFIYPNRSAKDTDGDSTNATSIRSFSSFGQGLGDDENRVYDLTCSWGRTTYLEEVATLRITRRGIEEGHFRHRLDGMRHNNIPCIKDSHCQWCYYKLMNEYDKCERNEMKDALKQNRKMIMRCLVCHVNLCQICEPQFHGADLSAHTKV